MKILSEATLLIPYSFIRAAHIYTTYEKWFKEISKTATKPEVWTEQLFNKISEIEIRQESEGAFRIPNLKFAKVMTTNDFDSVLLLSKDKNLLSQIDYH